MTETPQRPQDDDPAQVEDHPQPVAITADDPDQPGSREDDRAAADSPPEQGLAPPDGLPAPSGGQEGDGAAPNDPAASPLSDGPVPPGAPLRPPPYRGVYGQPPGVMAPSYGQGAYGQGGYGQQPYGSPSQGGPPAYAPQPYDPARGAYDPRWGYGPPGNPQHPQPGQPTGDDTTMALFCYVGALLGGFLVPLIFYLIKKNTSPFVRFHAAQALNYALTQMILVFTIILPLAVVALVFRQPAVLVLIVPVWLYEVISPYVWMILGAIRSNRGEWYTLPKWTCFRMVR